MRGTWMFLFVLMLLELQTADGYLNMIKEECEFNSTEPEDIQYINSYFYNKQEFIRFDSRVGRFKGFTKFGIETTMKWNRDSARLNISRQQKDTYCVPNVKAWYEAVLSKTVEPYAVLNPALNIEPSAEKDMVLVCSVYGFFPKGITVTWTNHQKPITTGVITTDLMPDADWYYQLHSHLEFFPRPGDQISCVVEHVSLKEPLVLDWEGPLSNIDKIMFASGACGLGLGLVLSLAGVIFYKRKSRGWVLVSEGS